MPDRGPVLGLDPGEARVGVAVSDDERRTAVPLTTLPARTPEEVVGAVADLVVERGATVVVVGHALSLSGEPGPAARRAEDLADALRAALGVPVVLHDERLSTAEAERALRDAGAAGTRRRAAVDRSAATIILQSWLDGAR